jgi:hypothetical protein
LGLPEVTTSWPSDAPGPTPGRPLSPRDPPILQSVPVPEPHRLKIMSSPHPTSVSFFYAVKLCGLLLFFPTKFEVVQKEDNALLAKAPPDETFRSVRVQRAFLRSACLVLACGMIGLLVGLGATAFSGCASSEVIKFLQVGGTCLLLWGTLFVRGWDVQTQKGVSLSERVNQWLYRFLYCVGTVVLVWSVSWTPC